MTNKTIEIAQTYLGNLKEDASLAQRVKTARDRQQCLEVSLTQSDRAKGRIQAKSTSGTTVGIIKSRDWSLRQGDVFTTESGKLLLIHLQQQRLMVLSFTEPVTDRAIELVHLGHALGNQHCPITIRDRKIYLQPTGDTAIIEKTIRDFQIPGLKIDYESRSEAMPLGLSPEEHLNFSHHTHHHS
ncbi:MAG: urease accessory protein UreE [Pleurocapsa sp. MO_226.B13]|nr:urease accessory protein UreE [Pleurocapsa sp. MO_226.B13]